MWLCHFLKYQDKTKLNCKEFLWVCCYGNEDSILLSVSTMAETTIDDCMIVKFEDT